MKNTETDANRIAKLEDELRRAKEKVKELRAEQLETLKLNDAMREQIKACDEQIEQWINAFDMHLGDNGKWQWSQDLIAHWDDEMTLLDRYTSLLRDWNRFVPKYNAAIAPMPIGRPLAASESQVTDVRKRRARGASLRAIAAATNLSLGTVCSILRRKEEPAVDRRLHKRELDATRAKIYRARKRQRQQVPDQANATLQRNAELLKAAKSLAEV